MLFSKRLDRLLIACLTLFYSSYGFAQSSVSLQTPGRSEKRLATDPVLSAVKSKLGISYALFFSGPGLKEETLSAPPNQFGRPEDDGINSFNAISFRYKAWEAWAVDFQTRTVVLFNNAVQSNDFSRFRWEAPRIGVSGPLMKGESWSLSGAINTDFPSFLPSPLTGFTAQQRQVFLNPGLFAVFNYKPTSSRFSVFSFFSPRYFFYGDRNAVEPQMKRGGFSSQNKPELNLALAPAVSYRLSDRLAASVGSEIVYTKQVGSSWSPLSGSLQSNGSSKAWRLAAVPLRLGATYTSQDSNFRVFPYVQSFPVAAQRLDAKTGQMTAFAKTLSIGIDINGVAF